MDNDYYDQTFETILEVSPNPYRDCSPYDFSYLTQLEASYNMLNPPDEDSLLDCFDILFGSSNRTRRYSVGTGAGWQPVPPHETPSALQRLKKLISRFMNR